MVLTLVATLGAATGEAQSPRISPAPPGDSLARASATVVDPRVQAVIERHLGRPYVWGATGLKSFDCSGFVWRVMQENGIFIKRTTARKYFVTLPKVPDEERWQFGNIVFFSDLKHCGIVRSPESFYHAAVSAGTHVAKFTPFWRHRISGVRAIPGLTKQGGAELRAK